MASNALLTQMEYGIGLLIFHIEAIIENINTQSLFFSPLFPGKLLNLEGYDDMTGPEDTLSMSDPVHSEHV